MSKVHDDFTVLDNARSGYRTKAQAYAAATMPFLYRSHTIGLDYMESSESAPLYPASSLPARGITQLASKFASALVPVSHIPFLGVSLRPTLMSEIEAASETKELFLRSTKRLQDEVFHTLAHSNLRDTLFLAFQHLQVFGDVLIRMHKDYKFTLHRFDRYIVVRDMYGNPTRIILLEWVHEHDLPEQNRAKMVETAKGVIQRLNSRLYPMYTEWVKEDNIWKETVSVGDVEVSTDTIPANRFTVFVPRWKNDPYDNYGIGLVEENYGDILAANAARQTLLESYSIAVSGFIGLKTGGMSPKQLEAARPWSVIPLNTADQVSFIQPNNIQAITAVESFDQRINLEIRRIFMMDVATELTHDRTTATQVLAAIDELNRYSGGILSAFETSTLRPIVLATIYQMVDDGVLGDEIEALVEDEDIIIDIKSGIDAMNRESQQRNVAGWILEMAQTIPDALNEVDLNAYVRWSAGQRGIPEIILKSPELKAAEQQAQAQQQLNEALTQQIPQTGGRILEQMVAQQGI